MAATTGARCSGSGRPWGSGTGTPICPTCHRGPRALGAKPPVRRQGRWTGSVPTHDHYATPPEGTSNA